MKLSTGKVAFPIEFDNGDKAVIYFNPQDKGIQERIKNFEKSIENRVKEIDFEKHKKELEADIGVNFNFENPEKLFEMSPEELRTLQKKIEAISDIEAEYNKAVKKELDVIFASDISDVVFRYCEPFDTVILEDGRREVYIMHFMYWLMLELKKYGAENKSAMDKHLAKYNK